MFLGLNSYQLKIPKIDHSDSVEGLALIFLKYWVGGFAPLIPAALCIAIAISIEI